MIRHVVLIRWNEDVDRARAEAVAHGLAKLPDQIPEIKRYEFGPDLGLKEDSWDFALVADFDDVPSLQVYATHPTHLAFIAEHMTPNVAQSIRVQYEV